MTAPGFERNRPAPGPIVQGLSEDGFIVDGAAYRALLRLIYPGRKVRCFLLWTTVPALAELDAAALDAAAPGAAATAASD